MRTIFACLAALAVHAATSVHLEDAADPPAVWQDIGKPHPEQNVDLIFAMKLRNVDQLEELALRVSTPGDELYGKHASLNDLDIMTSPDAAANGAVLSWLAEAGAACQPDVAGGFVTCPSTVAEAENLLDIEYRRYKHESNGQIVVRAAPGHAYSVPAAVAEVVDFVEPTRTFGETPTLKSEGGLAEMQEGLKNSSFFNIPSKLRTLYNVPEGLYGTNKNNSQGVLSMIQQYWLQTDLDAFNKDFAEYQEGYANITQVGNNNNQTYGGAGLEASLDVQTMTTQGAHIDTWVWYTASEDTPFLSWMVDTNKRAEIPYVWSASYGSIEHTVSQQYAERVNQEFAKLAARGVTMFVAAGDSGVAGNCTEGGKRFSPGFPASSTWVTTVGGLAGGTAGKMPTGEFADNISGGGFSDYFPTPSWQKDAVKAYLASGVSGLPSPSAFNASGRGYPDISSQSEMFIVIANGFPNPGVGGTSCASPTWAGLTSLLNDARLNAGKPSLGFLNPLLYQTGANTAARAFSDVTSGSNMGCEIFQNGFPATTGWDPVTGWGSMDFQAFRDVVMDAANDL